MNTFVKKFFIHEIITIFFVLITVVQFVQADEFTAPTISESVGIPYYSNDPTPSYFFETDEEGYIGYYGDCISTDPGDQYATIGINEITFDALPDGGEYYCQIDVVDEWYNYSNVLEIYFYVDQTAPVVTEVAPISSPTLDRTPEYSFETDEEGAVTYYGACSSLAYGYASFAGTHVIELDQLIDGAYSDCSLSVTDFAGNESSILPIPTFTVAAPPTIVEVNSVVTPSSDRTPVYSFTSDEIGTITYGGTCSSATTNAVVGINTIIFNELSDGTYSNCTIMVTDIQLNNSNIISVVPFVIDQQVPTSGDAVFEWVKSFGGAGVERGYDVETDTSGNVYTIGFFNDVIDFDPGPGVANLTPGSNYRSFLSKLDPHGNYLWAKRLTSAASNINKISVDTSGNVYAITGYFSGTLDFDPGPGVANLTSAGGTDISITKFDTDGNYVWAKSIGGASNDFITSLLLDTSGNLYATGSFSGTVDFDPGPGVANLTSSTGTYYILKIDSSGNFIWAKNNVVPIKSIGRDALGNLYIAGEFSGTVDFDPGPEVSNLTAVGFKNIFIYKIDSLGDFIWAKKIQGWSVEVEAFTIDSSGNIYLSGDGTSSISVTDFDPGPGVVGFPFSNEGNSSRFILKLDASGDFVWVKGIYGGNLGFSSNTTLSLDSFGNLYTAGSLYGTVDFDPSLGVAFLTSAGDSDIVISKLDSSGNFIWAKKIGGNATDYIYDLHIDPLDRIYTTGTFSGTVDFDPGVGVQNITALSNFPNSGGNDVFVSVLSPYGYAFITESIPVSSEGNDPTPSYTFITTKGGNISYGGPCSSSTTNAVLGTNTIIFNELAPGTYNDCTITVDDSNTLTISPFTITTPSIIPIVSGVVSVPVLVIPPPSQLILPIPKQIEPIIEKIKQTPKEEKKKTISPIDTLLKNIEEKKDTPEKQPPLPDTPPSEPLPNPEPEQPTTPKNSFTNTIAQPIQNSLSVLGTTLSTSFVSSIQVLSSLDTSTPVIFQSVKTSAVVIGSALAVAPVASSASGLAPLLDLPRLLAHLWNVLLTALGLRKKRKPWGTVYDSQTKQPLDPAYVTLTDMTGKEVASSLTDIDGRYGFVVPPGTYTLSAKKTNYAFPSKKLQGVFEDELYTSLYFGEQVTITEEGEIINKNIPLDQLAFDWNEFAKNEQHRLTYFKKRDVIFGKISQVLFIGGFLFSLIALFATPTFFQILVTLVYVIIFFVRRCDPKLKATGFISKQDGTPLPFAIIRLLSIATGQEIAHKVADKVGRYYAIVPNGTYNITIDEKTPDGSYIKHTLTRTVTITKGFLGEEVRV
jgi:hypothetical protein